jgi:hypothetical protein
VCAGVFLWVRACVAASLERALEGELRKAAELEEALQASEVPFGCSGTSWRFVWTSSHDPIAARFQILRLPGLLLFMRDTESESACVL